MPDDLVPLDVCCPTCWAMPDRDCHGKGRRVVAGDIMAQHPARAELAAWGLEPLRDWPISLGWREPPRPKVINHPAFEQGRRDGMANVKHRQVASWKTIKQDAYSAGHGIGCWKRYELSGLPSYCQDKDSPDYRKRNGISRDLLAETADALARCDGDRQRAGWDSHYGPYLSEQYFKHVQVWLPLAPLNDPPPPSDRTRQLHLMEAE